MVNREYVYHNVGGAAGDGWYFEIWGNETRKLYSFVLGISDGQKGDDERSHFWERSGYQTDYQARLDVMIVLVSEIGAERAGLDFLPYTIGAAVVNGSVVQWYSTDQRTIVRTRTKQTFDPVVNAFRLTTDQGTHFVLAYVGTLGGSCEGVPAAAAVVALRFKQGATARAAGSGWVVQSEPGISLRSNP